jgi:high-affinity nickel-transport protein
VLILKALKLFSNWSYWKSKERLYGCVDLGILKKMIKTSWVLYGTMVFLLHIIGFIFLAAGSKSHPFLLGMGFIAYTLGLRHAFDADHIAAIDNTVRKLIQQKKNPVGVGFFFSLGHSSIVFLMSVLLGISVQLAQKELPQWKEMGGIIGTAVSGCFLVIIGILNAFILFDLQTAFISMRKGTYNKEKIEQLLLSRGLLARFAGPLSSLVKKSWHVFPIGFLFGLGFDTASEVALLAISAGAAKSTLPFIGILSLPILFAAGMSLMDTADGIFMTHAYHWAFSTPLRKVYYNITITAISVVAALIIGLIELIQIFLKFSNLNNTRWQWIQYLDISWLGYILTIIFLLAWGLSYAIWKVFKIEDRYGKT